MEKEKNIFCRQAGVLSHARQRRLGQARVAVFGLGGVGGICAELLVRAGVGHLLVADFDRFEESNFNRQIHAQKETLGMKKADVFAKKAKSIDPEIEIRKISKKLEYESQGFFSGSLASFSPHVVIDTMDSVGSRTLLWRMCKKKRIAYVYSAASGERGMVSVVRRPADLERILHLPSFGRPDEEVESCLVHYPQCRSAWGPATNLVGVLAANAALNYLLGKPYPDAPKFWMSDSFDEKVVRKEKLA